MYHLHWMVERGNRYSTKQDCMFDKQLFKTSHQENITICIKCLIEKQENKCTMVSGHQQVLVVHMCQKDLAKKSYTDCKYLPHY